jgi:threonine efflux protein
MVIDPSVGTPLIMAFSAYVLAASSPGPSNLAIMNTAMSRGRVAALALAAGVVSVSWMWAVLASTGVATVLKAWPSALNVIQFIGGGYLLYLSARFAGSALRGKDLSESSQATLSRTELGKIYRRGIALHIANPKAIMGWIATISLGLKPGAPAYMPFIIMLGCAFLAVAIFGGYAIVFSLPAVSRGYQKAQRWIDGVLAVFFVIAGCRLVYATVATWIST